MSETPDNTPESPLPVPRRSVWKTVALGTVLLLCGMFIGSGLTLIGIKRRVDEFRARPDLLSERMVDRMDAELELTDKQTEEIRKIFGEARRESAQMRERGRAQAQAFFRDFQGKVSQVLTPSQQSEWEEWFRKARGRAMRERSGGPRDKDNDGKRGDGPPERGFGDRPRGDELPSVLGPPPEGIPERHFAPDAEDAPPPGR